MKKIVLLRHCDRLGSDYCGGGSDVSLSDEGLKKASEIAPFLAGAGFDAVYCSPMLRCRQTVEPYLKLTGMPETEMENLREMNFGEWENRSYSELESSGGRLFSDWISNPYGCAPPGGETMQDFEQRVLKSWQRISGNDRFGRILIVTHGGPIRTILSLLSGCSGSSENRQNFSWKFMVEKGRSCIINVYDDLNTAIECTNIEPAWLDHYIRN